MKRLTMIAALWLGASATATSAAVPAAASCITETEGEALVAMALPDILDAVGKTCAATLPPQATLRAGLPSLVARYRVDGDAAWRSAKPVIVKLGGDQLKGIDPDMVRPMIATLLGPMVVKGVTPGDCPTIDRIATTLAPLPIANTAALVMELYQLRKAHAKTRAPFSICADHG